MALACNVIWRESPSTIASTSLDYCFDFLDVRSWLTNVDFIYSLDFSHIPEWLTLLLGIISLLLKEIPNFWCALNISSPPFVTISHSCACSNCYSKKYWHWCHFSYPWCGLYKSNLLNCSHAKKNCSSSLWVNSKISLRIALGSINLKT